MLDTMTVHDELDFDLATADEALENATSSVAGAWAALRHASRQDQNLAGLVDRLVECLTVIRAAKKHVVEAKQRNEPAMGRSPEDWYMKG